MDRERACRKKENRTIPWVLIVSTWFGLSMNLKDPGKSHILLNLIASFENFQLIQLLLLPGLYYLFRNADETGMGSKRWPRLIPACFFALNMVLGFAMFQEGSWNMLLNVPNGQLIKAVFVWFSWSAVFYRLLTILWARLDAAASAESDGMQDQESRGKTAVFRKGFHPVARYTNLLRKHSFMTPFLTLLIIFIPHFFIAYPAMFMGDTWSMIVQGYSELRNTGVSYLPPENVIRAGVYINQHHPVAYTLLMHLFLQIGDGLFHSLNIGIFLLCLMQALMILAALAYAVSTLAKYRVSPKLQMLLLLYVILHPQIRNFLFLATKDGMYSASFIFAMSAYFRARMGNWNRRNLTVVCLAALGMILLRNEGRYVLAAAGLLMAWADRKPRKAVLCFTAAVAVASLGIYQGLYPALGFTEGGVQEMLSIPLQQTARVVREHPDGISDSEREAINAVLEYDRLAENYNPDTADHVKELFRQEATGKDIMTWLRTWAGLVWRYPDTCLQATYGNYYQYLYPGETRIEYHKYGWSAWMCEYANDQIAGLGKSFSLPEWNRSLRYISDSLVDAGMLNIPPLSLMMTPSLYSWVLITMLFRIIGKRKGKIRAGQLAMMILPLLTFLVLFAGPINGYYSRYMLPLTSFLPFLAVMIRKMGEAEALQASDPVRG